MATGERTFSIGLRPSILDHRVREVAQTDVKELHVPVPPDDGLIGIVPLQVLSHYQEWHAHTFAEAMLVCGARAARECQRGVRTRLPACV